MPPMLPALRPPVRKIDFRCLVVGAAFRRAFPLDFMKPIPANDLDPFWW